MNGKRQAVSGLGMIGAIFLITVVAFLVVAITRSINTSAQAHALEVTSSQALLAAESGAQLGVQAVHPASGTGTCALRTWSFDGIGLPGCQVTVQCQVELVDGRNFYTIESAGRCSDGGLVTAERVVMVRTRS